MKAKRLSQATRSFSVQPSEKSVFQQNAEICAIDHLFILASGMSPLALLPVLVPFHKGSKCSQADASHVAPRSDWDRQARDTSLAHGAAKDLPELCDVPILQVN